VISLPLSITTIKGQIGIKTTNAYLDVRQPKGEQSIRQIKAQMIVDRQLPKVLIDQSQPFAEAGRKPWSQVAAEYAQMGRQQAIEGIARIVDDGNRMAMIQRKMPEAIPEIALKNSTPKQHEFNFGMIPTSRPRIEVTGHLNIDWQIGGVEYNFTPRRPVADYHPGKAEIYMEQYPQINFKYIDNRV